MTNTGRGLERAVELSQRIGFSGAWSDASLRKPLVCRKGLEQCNNLLEECDSLSARGAARRETRRLQGAVASPMGGPLVLRGNETRRYDVCTAGSYLPELFVLAVDVDPEFLHERQSGTGALSGQQLNPLRIRQTRRRHRAQTENAHH